MKLPFLAICVLMFCRSLPAQVITGTIRGQGGEIVQGATVMLKYADSAKVMQYAVSDQKGNFRIRWVHGPHYILRIQHIAYDPVTVRLDTIQDQHVDVLVNARKQELKEIVIKTQIPVVVRNDTVIYNANAYMSGEVRKVDELLGKMQGFGVSADGRITYNGKPVEKVLVDGEDLAGRGYQLLTRNLGAGYVDKVEVITNFSPNRLVGTMGRQDAVGVNLRIKEKYRDKVNLSIDLAYGGRRYRGSGTALSLRRSYKAFAFADANNIAEDVMGSLANIPEGEGFPEGSMSGTLEAGKVLPPPVSDRYCRDNRDAAAALMVSWRPGRHNRSRMLIGYSGQQLLNRGTEDLSTAISDTLQWQVNNKTRESQRVQSPFVKWIGQRDDSLGKVDDYFLDLKIEKPKVDFSNITSLAIEDSLLEQLLSQRIYVGAGWNATRARQEKKLFRLGTEGYFMGSEENFRSSTSRYAEYYGLPSGYDKGSQLNKLQRLRLKTDASWIQAGKNGNSRYGFSAFVDHSLIETFTVISGMLDPRKYEGRGTVTSAGADLHFSKTLVLRKNKEMTVLGKGGPRYAKAGTVGISFPGFDVSTEFVKRFSALRSFRAGITVANDIPDLLRYLPAPAISGNATILEGMALDRSELSGRFKASYFNNNIKRQSNSSLSLLISASPSFYTTSVWVEPAYTASRYQWASGGLSFHLMGGVEKYMGFLKGKLGLSGSASAIRNRFNINGTATESRNENLQGEIWWISAFPGRLGLESRLRAGWSKSAIRGQPGSAAVRGGSSQRIQWKPDQGSFLSLILNSVQLGSGTWFHGMDIYGRKKLGNGWALSVKGVNLLNAGAVREKSVYPYSSSQREFLLVSRYVLLGVGLDIR